MDNLCDPSKRHEVEYAAQLFDFSTDAFADILVGDAEDVVAAKLQDAKKKCAEAFKGKLSGDELEAAFQRIEQHYIGTTDKIFLKLQMYIKENVLNIPSHVLLPEDAAHAQAGLDLVNSSDVELALATFERLAQEARNTKISITTLKDKIANLKKVSEMQRPVMSQVAQMEELMNVVKCFDQKSSTMHKKSVDADNLLVELENNVLGDSIAKPEAEKKKRKFIETEDEIIVKRVRGIDDSD